MTQKKKPVAKAIPQIASIIPFGHRHYVPVLKSKGGELWALEQTTNEQRAHITPLLEVHREGEKTITQHVKKVMSKIEKAWGTRPFFLDTHLFGTAGNTSVTSASSIFQAAEDENLTFIPVTALARSNAYQGVIARHATQHGVMIRLTSDDFYNPTVLKAHLDSLLGQLGLPISKVDVLIDYGEVVSHATQVQLIRTQVSSLPYLQEWRTLTIAGGAFPASLAAQSPHQWHHIPREDWMAWSIAVTTSTPALKRLPAYGDYGVRDTQPPAEFGSPYANIRYTSGGLFLVRRHDILFRKGGSDGIYPICTSLIARPEFSGPAFSAGDGCIATTAVEQASPGNPGSWTQWGMSHHFAVVVAEIQSLLAA